MTVRQLRNGVTGDPHVVGRLVDELCTLTTKAPRAMIEFVRLARNRKHNVFGSANVHNLGTLGLIDTTRTGYTTHDVWRDMVKGTVIGDGLTTRIICPIHGEPPVDTLRDGSTKAYLPLVDFMYREFSSLQQESPVAFVELLRLCGEAPRQRTFGNTLQTLATYGYIEVQQPQVESAGDLSSMLSGMLSDLVAGMMPQIVVHDVVKALLPLCVEGERGLSVRLCAPYDQQRNRRRPTRDCSEVRNGDRVATV